MTIDVTGSDYDKGVLFEFTESFIQLIFIVTAYTYWAKRLSDHFCMYNSVTSLSFLISLQNIITHCRLPILSIIWGSSLSLPCCEGGYKKLADFQVMKNGQILINIFSNVKALPFLSKLHFESEKMSHWFLRYCQMKLVILTQKCIF